MGIEAYLIILVLLIGFYMAWNIGANDVANAMGTSIGSGALTLKKAVIIAGILEFSGALLLGSHVSETMQTGIVNPDLFLSNPDTLLFGMLAALLATAVWLQVASFFGWPVSTTHAIVGAILGFGALIAGVQTVKWKEVGSIAASWVISPGLSALISYFIFSLLQKKILFALNPVRATKKLIPILVFFVFFIFVISMIFNGMENIHLKLNAIEALLISLAIALLCSVTSHLLLKKQPGKEPLPEEVYSPDLSQHVVSLNKAAKHLRRVRLSSTGEIRSNVSKILKETESLSKELKEKSHFFRSSTEYQKVEKMFGYLQLISACFVAFAHGANDVANAIGPVAAVLEIIRFGSLNVVTHIPSWLLALGGAGIVVGLATWGWRVIETIGRKITELTPTRGFSAEFGAATTILLASKLGLPVSTTHCVVGAVLGVGLAKGISALNLRMLRDIALSWIVTIPSSALVCILFYYLIKAVFSPFLS
ncbi:MAG: inorganic phosphate transporter [Simkaniaceae bacterium]